MREKSPWELVSELEKHHAPNILARCHQSLQSSLTVEMSCVQRLTVQFHFHEIQSFSKVLSNVVGV
jgi:hypothetical protein